MPRTKKAADTTAPAAQTTRIKAAKAPEDPREAIAKALSKALGYKHTAEDVRGFRDETATSQIAVTAFGNKARVFSGGDVEILVGPGMPAVEVAEPAPPAAADETVDLPPLEAKA